MKLNKKLTTKQFIISQLLLLLVGAVILGGIYYILNIQYYKDNKPFLNGPVTTLPKSLRLDLDQPDDNTLFFQVTILVSGKTEPLKEVLISTDSQDFVIKSKKDGSFSTEINLDEGENTVTAVVFDIDGDSRALERTVYYSKEKI